MRKLQNKGKVLDLLNRFPSKTNRDIAKETNCNENTVAKYRKVIDLRYDSEFVSVVAGKWIKYYSLAAELFLKYITQLEEYKEYGTKTISTTDGTVQVPLSGVEKGQLVKIQSDILTKLCDDAGNGEIREVIRLMRVGKIPNYT